jgi:hypothetical protein
MDFLNPETVKSLVEQGQEWGLSVTKVLESENSRSTHSSGIKNIINFGEIVYDDLSYEGEDEEEYTPFGYSDDYEEPKRFITQDLEILTVSREFLPENSKIVLKSFDIIPPNHAASRPFIAFESKNEMLSNMEFKSGTPFRFKLKCSLPVNYHGSLNRLLILDFVSTREINSFSKVTVSFTVGVLFLGNVVDKAAHHLLKDSQSSSKTNLLNFVKKDLSTEAAPFIPLSEMFFFNSQVSRFSKIKFFFLIFPSSSPFYFIVCELFRRTYALQHFVISKKLFQCYLSTG